jgi:Type of WD40 repeat
MCEIDRFLRLTNNVVEVVSFIVPRKTQATHFQADIFPPAPSGQPGLSAASWLSGSSAPLLTVSMKPAHLPEDAPSSAPSTPSGQLSPTANNTPPSLSLSPTLSSTPAAAPFQGSGAGVPTHAGPMLLEVKGWFYTGYEPKFFSISANQILYCFANKESAEALFSVPLSTITELRVDPNHCTLPHHHSVILFTHTFTASRFSIVLAGGFHNLEAYNQADREKWLRALSNNKAPPPPATVQEVCWLTRRMRLGNSFNFKS